MGSEKNFENKIKNFLKSEGCWNVKFFANAYTKSGIPDIMACVNGYFVGIEVKAEDGKPTDLQIYHVKQIRQSGGFAFVLYPSGFEKFKQFIHDLKADKFNHDMEVICR